MVKILERLGHEVDFPESQTCCGQPPFNSGYWDEARGAAETMLDAFRNSDVVVGASGSCGAMLKVFYPELFHGHAREAEAKALSGKVHEFSSFLVNELKVTDLGSRFAAKVTYHDGCHGMRELGIKKEPRELLKRVRGLELVEMKEAETCCGFGGTFAVKFPEISSAMGEVKCASALETDAEYVVSGDSSCLMQIQGMLQRQRTGVKTIHLAELLAHQD